MKILTKYVKNKIKGLSFDNMNDRKYIEELLYIELKLSQHPKNWGYAGAMALHFNQQTYPEEYDEIYKELNPEGFKKVLRNRIKNKRERKKQDEEWRIKEDAKIKAFKKEWKKAGGK